MPAVVLDLSFGDLTELPSDFEWPHDVEAADLSFNKLRALLLPAGGLPRLVRLTARYNALSQLPDLALLPALEELNLEGNAIHELPDGLCGRNGLRALCIGAAGHLSSDDVFARIAGHPVLESLAVDGLAVREGPGTPCFAGLETLQTLRRLKLDLGILEPEQIDEIFERGAALPRLEELDLEGVSFATIPPTVARWSALRRIDLSGNDLLEELPAELLELPRLERINVRDSYDVRFVTPRPGLTIDY